METYLFCGPLCGMSGPLCGARKCACDAEINHKLQWHYLLQYLPCENLKGLIYGALLAMAEDRHTWC